MSKKNGDRESQAKPPKITLQPVNLEPFSAKNLLLLYMNTFVGASFAESCVYPLDVAKTRMQVEGELTKNTSAKTRNMFSTLHGIARHEGIKGMYSGLSAMTVRNLSFNSLRVVIYDIIRRQFIYINEKGKEVLTVPRACLAGCIAGCLAQAVSNPLDIVKVRMQMEGRRRLQGLPVRARNAKQALQDIYKREGISQMWNGVTPSCLRACLMTVGDVGSYDLSKRNFKQYLNLNEGVILQLLSSLSAGLVASVLSNPADVIKSRIMNQPVDEQGKGLLYKNSAECFLKLIKEEGPLTLYKGLLPCWFRLGPWSVLFWMSLEQLRKWEGQSGF